MRCVITCTLVMCLTSSLTQGQTVPGGSASKPGGAPSGGGGSDDNQECVYYGIPPEFDIRQGRGIFFELWFGGSHVYDYDYVNKVAYPTSPYSFFGPNGPVGVADLSALLAQARKPRPKPYTGPKMIAPLNPSTAAFFERVSEREARVEFAVNTFYEVAVTIQEVATRRPRPRPRPRPSRIPYYRKRNPGRDSMTQDEQRVLDDAVAALHKGPSGTAELPRGFGTTRFLENLTRETHQPWSVLRQADGTRVVAQDPTPDTVRVILIRERRSGPYGVYPLGPREVMGFVANRLPQRIRVFRSNRQEGAWGIDTVDMFRGDMREMTFGVIKSEMRDLREHGQ